MIKCKIFCRVKKPQDVSLTKPTTDRFWDINNIFPLFYIKTSNKKLLISNQLLIIILGKTNSNSHIQLNIFWFTTKSLLKKKALRSDGLIKMSVVSIATKTKNNKGK